MIFANKKFIDKDTSVRQ